MAGLRRMNEFRRNPFTDSEAGLTLAVTTEVHQIPLNSPYWVGLAEVPREDGVSTVTVYDQTDGVWLTEVTAAPVGNREFMVDYDNMTAYLLFNALQANHLIYVNYYGRGSPYEAGFLNKFFEFVAPYFSQFPGDASDGSLAANAGGDQTLASVDGVVARQYNNLTVTNNTRLIGDANAKLMVIAVSGTLQVDAGSELSMTGLGGAGGVGVVGAGHGVGGDGGYDAGDGGTALSAGGEKSNWNIAGSGGGGGKGGGDDGGGGGGAGATGGNGTIHGGAVGTAGAEVDTPLRGIIQNTNPVNYGPLLLSTGGGGGSGAEGGDGGGDGGAVLIVLANKLLLTGNITADGTDGAAGGGANEGGGGGGGGGVAVVIYNFKSGAGTVSADGGAGGASGGGIGSAGLAGGPGQAFEIELGDN